MKTIKIISNFTKRYFTRQTPNNSNMWKGNKYIINNKNISKCDWCVVFEALSSTEYCQCPKQNTILITGEPPNIKTYHPKFIKQFSTIITTHINIKHSNIIHTQQGIPWMLSIYKKKSDNIPHDYDTFMKDSNFKKTKLISVISSNKQITKGHRQRYKFVKILKQYFGNMIDVFGVGINKIPDKWEGINPYKYHIAIENESLRDYWTEKLSDTFLANTYPIYSGCPNIYDYFSKHSLSTIDINNIEQSIKTIEGILQSNTFEKYQKNILIAKNMILNKYNIFEVIHKLIHNQPIKDKSNITIKPEYEFLWQNKLINFKNKILPNI